MKLLKELNEGQNLAHLHGMSAKQIEQAFLANYVAGLVIMRVGDVSGLINIRSRGIDRMSPAMSYIDFWGYVLFRAGEKELKRNLSTNVVKELKVDTGRIIDARVKKIFDVFKHAPDLTNWLEVVYTLKLLQIRFEVMFPQLNAIARTLYDWDRAGAGARGQAISQSLRFLQMSDSHSPLVQSLRDLSGGSVFAGITNVAGTVATKLKRAFKLKEEDLREEGEGGGEAGGEAMGGTPSNASAISAFPQLIFKSGKIVRRKQRKFKVRRWKDPTSTNGDYSNVRIN